MTLIKMTLVCTLSPFFQGHYIIQKGNRKVQGVPQPQTAALPKSQEEEESSCGHGTKAVIQNHKSINE